MKQKLLEIMKYDHRRIDGLLGEFIASEGKGFAQIAKAFNRFRLELEKHIFAEESAIQPGGGINKGTLARLKKEHETILKMMIKMKNDISSQRKADSGQLRNFLGKHNSFEESVFYPMLESSLEPAQMQVVIKKISTCILE